MAGASTPLMSPGGGPARTAGKPVLALAFVVAVATLFAATLNTSSPSLGAGSLTAHQAVGTSDMPPAFAGFVAKIEKTQARLDEATAAGDKQLMVSLTHGLESMRKTKVDFEHIKARIDAATATGNSGLAGSLQHGLDKMLIQMQSPKDKAASVTQVKALNEVATGTTPPATATGQLEKLRARVAAATASGNTALAASLQHGLDHMAALGQAPPMAAGVVVAPVAAAVAAPIAAAVPAAAVDVEDDDSMAFTDEVDSMAFGIDAKVAPAANDSDISAPIAAAVAPIAAAVASIAVAAPAAVQAGPTVSLDKLKARIAAATASGNDALAASLQHGLDHLAALGRPLAGQAATPAAVAASVAAPAAADGDSEEEDVDSELAGVTAAAAAAPVIKVDAASLRHKGFKTIRLTKKTAGFGMSISNNAEVISFNKETDGSDGPAKAAGVVQMSRILEVNGVTVQNKADLIAKLAAPENANEVVFGFQPPEGKFSGKNRGVEEAVASYTASGGATPAAASVAAAPATHAMSSQQIQETHKLDEKTAGSVKFVPYPHNSMQQFSNKEDAPCITGHWSSQLSKGSHDQVVLASERDTVFHTDGPNQLRIFTAAEARVCLWNKKIDFAGESYHKQTFIGLSDILLSSTSNDENPHKFTSRHPPPFVDQDSVAAQEDLNAAGFSNIRLICSKHPECYGQTKGPPEEGAPGPHPRNHHAWMRMIQSTPELNSLEECGKCLKREKADKSDALFVSANSHLLVSRNANFGKMVKTKGGKKTHAANSPEAKGLALGDVKTLWNQFPNMVWATGPGHLLKLASDTQKNILGDGSASSWLDMSTCGPLYTPEGVKTRPPCMDFFHMTTACKFANCSADGGHRSRFVNRMKAQMLLNMMCE